MTNHKPCAVIVRPMDTNDPCLSRVNNNYVLERTLMDIRRAGGLDAVALSISPSVPAEIRETLSSWDVDTLPSSHEQPQRRLLECMDRFGTEYSAVFTSYSVLMDVEALARAFDQVRGGRADAAFTHEVIAPKFFMVINKKAARFLAETYSQSLPPFVFPEKLRQNDALSIVPLEGLEPPRERFLWELLFAGERCAVPDHMLGLFLDAYPPRERYDRKAFDAFINEYYQLKEPDLLETAVKKMARHDSSLRLAKHVNYARRLCGHLPENRQMGLEIGFGKTPLTSLLMGLVFERMEGADVYKYSSEGVTDGIDFLSAMEQAGLNLLPRETVRYDARSLSQRARFHHMPLQQVPLADNSVDFCFSKVVLEHVKDVPSLSEYLARTMRPGGVMLHEIGFQDHIDLSYTNFEFLRYSREEWADKCEETNLWRNSDKGTNLWRVNDFIELWEGLGFEVEVLERNVRVVPPASLHPSWRGYGDDDLYCYRAILKTIKQGG